MEGRGEFKHSNGKISKGSFRRNYFLQDKCFINPLDEDKKQKLIMKVFEEQVLGQREKIAYDKRMRLFSISNLYQLEDSLKET